METVAMIAMNEYAINAYAVNAIVGVIGLFFLLSVVLVIRHLFRFVWEKKQLALVSSSCRDIQAQCSG